MEEVQKGVASESLFGFCLVDSDFIRIFAE